jgi:hypothetical protein
MLLKPIMPMAGSEREKKRNEENECKAILIYIIAIYCRYVNKICAPFFLGQDERDVRFETLYF